MQEASSDGRRCDNHQGGDRRGGRCGAQGSARPVLRRRPSPGFVAGLLAAGTEDACRVLGADAGIGALSDAFLRRWLAGGLGCQRVAVDACEINAALALDVGWQSD